MARQTSGRMRELKGSHEEKAAELVACWDEDVEYAAVGPIDDAFDLHDWNSYSVREKDSHSELISHDPIDGSPTVHAKIDDSTLVRVWD